MDMQDFTTEQIRTALMALVDSGRLSGEIYVDGRLIVATTEPNPAQIWDDNGFSIATLHNGLCVRSRACEMLLDDLAANGDEFDKAAAAQAPHFFAMMVPGREYTFDQQALLDRSRPETMQMVTGFLGGMSFSKFYPDSVAGDNPHQQQIGMTLGEPAPDSGQNGVWTPVKGDAADDDYKDVLFEFKHKIKGAAYKARRAAIPGAPKPIA